ncbi:glycosyltransferase family 4 protein [bacterium]|nr:glycosyltransferase family 4 protein [bacterium]
MKVLFLPQTSALGPSSRYRVYQLLPHLERLGIQGAVSPGIDDDRYRRIYQDAGAAPGKLAAWRAARRQRAEDLRRVDQFDAVFVQKGVLPGISRLETVFAKRRPLVYDFDDAVWLPRVGGNPLLRLAHRESRFRDILRSVTAVIAGNDHLAEYARQFNSHVTVVPTGIDWGKYPEVSSQPFDSAQGLRQSAVRTARPATIGWIGSRSTLAYLKSLGPVFRELGIVPRVIASGDPAALGFDVDFVPWQPETELTELAKLDIGLAPLPDTPWEQGKCGAKLLQYLACGIPAVASPVGVHRQIIRHGENGLLASTPAEWRDCLSQLLEDPVLCQRLGAAGRRTVEATYDLSQIAQQVAAVIRSVTR